MYQILVVDDDRQIRNVLRQALTQIGLAVTEAADGGAAMRLLNIENNIKLVITDIIMPNKEGLEFIREIRKKNPEIRIIAISGGAQRIDIQNILFLANKFGADRVFQKPFEIHNLITAVNELLSQNHA